MMPELYSERWCCILLKGILSSLAQESWTSPGCCLLGSVEDVSSDDTACNNHIPLIISSSFLHEWDRTADQSLRAFEVLEELLVINDRIAICVSHEWWDLTIVVRWGQSVVPAGPDWDGDLWWVEQRIVLIADKCASVAIGSPVVNLEFVFSFGN